MRVLMTADAVGGVWVYAMELCRELCHQGIEVHLATMGPLPSPTQRLEAQAISNLHLHESDYKLEWMPDPWEDVAEAGAWLLTLNARVKPDLIHLNGYFHAAQDWQVPTVVVCHSCVLSWWRAVKGDHAPSEWRRYGFEVAHGLRSASAVVAPSHAMMDDIRNCYGPPFFSRVIPNGRRLPQVPAFAKESFIFAAGRVWDEAKNIGALSSIAEELAWPVHVAGDGNCEEAGTRFLGRLTPDEVAREMARASIYALPAKYEPFGLSILEAALSGCALVLGDIPSLRENWNGAARFVHPDDRVGLKREISELIDDPNERLALGRRALSRARRFTPEKMAAGYLSLYEELLATVLVGAGKERKA